MYRGGNSSNVQRRLFAFPSGTCDDYGRNVTDSAAEATYEPTWDSVSTHPLPDWYDDAKLGIFLHWGLYSVPGWAPQVSDIQQVLRDEGPAGLLRDNPYAEWYRNSMQIKGGATWKHHRETYGSDFGYDDFVPMFNAGSTGADLGALAGFCSGVGARYVVLTTKHHDGFTLWPASEPHPQKGHYHAERDLVGDLTRAVNSTGMRMGLYYSGGYDWPFNNYVMTRAADAILATPSDPAYQKYAAAHVRELVDRYEPAVLWNDVCWPGGGSLADIFAHYYNTVDAGVVNDRWLESAARRNRLTDAMTRGMGDLLQAIWEYLPDDMKSLTFPAAHHYDFNTPEYATFDHIAPKKWEATRGVGHSFGANRNERPEDIVTTTELVRSLCDIVSKNGNLLIGIGPMPDGTIPEEQQRPLVGLGKWLEVNGDAIYGTRPAAVAGATTTEGTPVRFTVRSDVTYALLLDTPGARSFGIRGVDASDVGGVRLLGTQAELEWTVDSGGMLHVTLPNRIPVSAALVLALAGPLRPIS